MNLETLETKGEGFRNLKDLGLGLYGFYGFRVRALRIFKALGFQSFRGF